MVDYIPNSLASINFYFLMRMDEAYKLLVSRNVESVSSNQYMVFLEHMKTFPMLALLSIQIYFQ